MNKVQLIGNLGKDPEVRVLQSGKKMANLSIATTESWKDRQTGEKRSKTEWHRVVVWNEGLATVCENYLKKGSRVFLEGSLQTRKWTDQAGQDKYTTEVVLPQFGANLIMLCGLEQLSKSNINEQGSHGDYAGEGQRGSQETGGIGSGPDKAELDDEIPF